MLSLCWSTLLSETYGECFGVMFFPLEPLKLGFNKVKFKEVIATSKALKYTEVPDLILGEGSLYGCPWALGKGHEGKEYEALWSNNCDIHPDCSPCPGLFCPHQRSCWPKSSPALEFMVQMQSSLAPLMGACMQMYLGVGLALPGSWSFMVWLPSPRSCFGRASLILCTLESFQTVFFCPLADSQLICTLL